VILAYLGVTAQMKEPVIAKLGQAGKILDARAPNEAAAFKSWLKYVADRVAESASEAGVLGFGGTRVPDTKRAMIAEVGRALNAA
jgi:hypothetical protein